MGEVIMHLSSPIVPLP